MAFPMNTITLRISKDGANDLATLSKKYQKPKGEIARVAISMMKFFHDIQAKEGEIKLLINNKQKTVLFNFC